MQRSPLGHLVGGIPVRCGAWPWPALRTEWAADGTPKGQRQTGRAGRNDNDMRWEMGDVGCGFRRSSSREKKARGRSLPRAFVYHEASTYFINIIFLLFTNFSPDAPVAVIR